MKDKFRKGIILAGGMGTRLYPITIGVSKQALPIFNKPMIYYPLSSLMLCGIKDIAIVTNPENIKIFKKILGDGSDIGIRLKYFKQEKPEGLPQAFTICKKFIKNDPTVLMLGDNIFHGHNLQKIFKKSSNDTKNASIITYKVNDPENFGVANFNSKNKIIELEEKPEKPKSNYIITGIYFMPGDVCKNVINLKKSKRGEYEILDLLKVYLKKNKLKNISLGRGYAWFDTGTFENMISASNFIKSIENLQKHHVGNIDEIAFRSGFTDKKKLLKRYNLMKKSLYGNYLKEILDE